MNAQERWNKEQEMALDYQKIKERESKHDLFIAFVNLKRSFIEEAKERGFKKVLGSVCIATNNCERNLLIYLKSGWKIINIDKTLIYFEKEI